MQEIFPVRLHFMLENTSLWCANVVSWQPHGRAFRIHNKKQFVAEMLPFFFSYQKEFSSFQRQLNMYGFLRLLCPGPDASSYYHPLFLRGRPDLCTLIRRNRIAGTSFRRSFDSSTEPNFYDMEPLVPDCAYDSAETTASERFLPAGFFDGILPHASFLRFANPAAPAATTTSTATNAAAHQPGFEARGGAATVAANSEGSRTRAVRATERRRRRAPRRAPRISAPGSVEPGGHPCRPLLTTSTDSNGSEFNHIARGALLERLDMSDDSVADMALWLEDVDLDESSAGEEGADEQSWAYI